MIPHQLTLKNFLSYREATLNFQGLHTACICGSNGAGKSSLLEAIAWSIWGNSRVATEDDIIRAGEKEARVDFIFQTNQHIYRVIRSRQRGQSAALEFQMATSEMPENYAASDLVDRLAFRSLTERGVRATQEKIIEHVKLDYDTFVNSSYLRQGRADEFMLKRPGERKQVLARLLRLDRYDELSDRAKERSRQAKANEQAIEQSLEAIAHQLQDRAEIGDRLAQVEADIAEVQAAQQRDRDRLSELQTRQLQRQNWQNQLKNCRQRDDQLAGDCDRLQGDLSLTERRLRELDALLQQADDISAGYAEFEGLQKREESEAAKFHAYQDAQHRRSQLQQELRDYLSSLETQLASARANYDSLEERKAELHQSLDRLPEVESAIAQLQAARDRLAVLDELKERVTPAIARRQELQTQLDRLQARLTARLEEINGQIHRLQSEVQTSQVLRETALEVGYQIEELEKKRVYQQRVREKGLERRHFMERLQAHQRDYETQLAELDRKIEMLQVPDAICPLCDRPLDEHHWDLVVHKHGKEQQEIIDRLWVIREQLAVSDREIQILRDEYRQLDRQLADYDRLRERRGSLQAQLDQADDRRSRLEQLEIERQQLERSIASGDYGGELTLELEQLDRAIAQLNYNDRDHALAFNEEKRWRWAEIKQAQLQQARRELENLQQRQPELQRQIAELETALTREREDSDLDRELQQLERSISAIAYDRREHQALREALQQARLWEPRMAELQQARQRQPELADRSRELSERLQGRSRDRQAIVAQIEQLQRQLAETPDATEEIDNISRQIERSNAQLQQQFGTQGRLQQQQQHLDRLQETYEQKQRDLADTRRQLRVYQELATAFGKNGIQALTIENVLPQLEAETNQILARLSGNQLHVQFVTQRVGKSRRKSAKKNPKLIDTLDILIADARGTRPYETYSGGEAFRINFSIRLALARLLAQRSGTALQMLIVDEGFGTQDNQGCDRLIAAINAIAPEFACILAVTHMPQFKEAFQSRIEVRKTEKGSQLSLSF
ncbi:ATP-binding cassette family protein [Oxynema sp. CENA135]|uniref:AAA family ATPase n=1 Tax=Oxynema sp. CENA135 TaxID=984206 RepID=UPI00190E483E|nr:SbcC/MukB-like Walker B domain-containing protein [Oxynema sp. CENA135]MBK4728737.1 ATP-binding cassette family protein [Oxynema sp. CENA135]